MLPCIVCRIQDRDIACRRSIMNCDATVLHHNQVPGDFTDRASACWPGDCAITYLNPGWIVLKKSVIDDSEGIGSCNVGVAAGDCNHRGPVPRSLCNLRLVDRHRQSLMIEDVER